MPNSWANSLDLHVELGGARLRDSLERSLRDAVRTGRLAPGTQLPSSRALAADLGIARNTVAEAYAQLGAEGWLTARQGSGTRVAAQLTLPEPSAREPQTPERAVKYNLRPGYPDLGLFPRAEWLTAARAALAKAPTSAFGYADPRGLPEVRASLAGYLARARGVQADPEWIVVCSGYAQALWLLATALHRQGARRVGVESHGHRQHREILTQVGLDVVPLPVDGDGAVPTGLDRLDAAVLTPAHQFPLGVALAAARRGEFARWAARTGGIVIEDDYDGEFRYDRRAIGAMQALAPDHIVYAGTASKTLAPGLRLAWLALPPRLAPDVIAVHGLIERNSPVLDQLTLAEFIDSGRYDRHIRRSRQGYRARRERLLTTLGRRVPSASVLGLPAGLHALVGLPRGHTEADVMTRAKSRGLAVDGLSSYAMSDDDRPPALVVGYATPPAHAYTNAVARLCATLT